MTAGAIALVVGSYLVGAFPTAHLVAGRGGHDPIREGSGNPGATNVYRVAGRRAGAVVALGDVAKGAVPTLVAVLVSGRPLAAACWVAAVLGHVFPLPRRFRGGKGVATAGGGALVLDPWVALALVAVFLLVARVSRRASLGSLAVAIGLPVLVAAGGRAAWEIAVAAAISVLVIIRHADNIARLLHHDERAYRAE